MASKPISLKVEARGKRIPSLPAETSVYLQGSANELYERLAKEAKFSVHQLRITNKNDGKPIANDKKISISSIGLQNGDVIQVKDLGPQIAWRTVFIIEYLGPLLIHPLVFLLRPYIYANAPAEPSTLQVMTLITICLHFLKREIETLFIHRFSNATMPVRNIFKNSFHYWVLSGLLIAYFSYAPTSSTAEPDADPLFVMFGLQLFVAGEAANLITHVILRNLRSQGGTERGVPQGLGFDWVTCPNYLFETIAWLGILMINRNWSTAVFIAVAVGQMAVWAKKKEKRYRDELGAKYPKKKYAMIPGIW